MKTTISPNKSVIIEFVLFLNSGNTQTSSCIDLSISKHRHSFPISFILSNLHSRSVLPLLLSHLQSLSILSLFLPLSFSLSLTVLTLMSSSGSAYSPTASRSSCTASPSILHTDRGGHCTVCNQVQVASSPEQHTDRGELEHHAPLGHVQIQPRAVY